MAYSFVKCAERSEDWTHSLDRCALKGDSAAGRSGHNRVINSAVSAP